MKSKIRRQDIIERLIIDADTNKDPKFWGREMAILKRLEKRYSLEFLNELTFYKKVDSLMYLSSKKLQAELDLKFKKFNYSPAKTPEEDYNVSEKKFGEDRAIERPKKTTRDFLNG